MRGAQGLRESIPGWVPPSRRSSYTLGVFRGEGIGAEVIEACLQILDAATKNTGVSVSIRQGGPIGKQALRKHKTVLTRDVIDFCQSVFAQEGAVLCGPGSGRFVYDLRKALDLYCKLTPIIPIPVVGDAGVIKPETRRDVDIMVVREIASGEYLGRWEEVGEGRDRSAIHHFSYTTAEVERVLRIALTLAAARRHRLAVILKPNGVPSISKLWMDTLERLDKPGKIEIDVLEVDNAAFQIVQTSRNFDVVVAPNLYGDIIADVAGLLLGSRGMCYSGNFGDGGIAVYNTGHGAAYDLAGRDQANPLGQVFAMTMALRTSYNLVDLANLIDRAADVTLRHGWRTADIAAAGCTIVGTRELTRRVIATIEELKQEGGV